MTFDQIIQANYTPQEIQELRKIVALVWLETMRQKGVHYPSSFKRDTGTA